MLDEFKVLEKVKAVSSRKEKEALLVAGDSPILRRIASLAYDYKNTFGISVDTPAVSQATPDPLKVWSTFEKIAELLIARKVTGNKARNGVKTFLDAAGEDAIWYARILNSDLECGCDIKTFKKVFPGVIETFDVMLANVYEKGTSLKLPVALEIKFDGLRTVTIVESGHGTCFSRYGNEFTSLQDFADELAKHGDGVYDGEILSDSWNSVSSIARCKKGDEATRERARANCNYRIFDFLTLDEWKKKKCTRKLLERRTLLEEQFEKIEWDQIRISEQYICSSLEEVLKTYDTFLEQGEEGVMLKDVDGVYQFKRSDFWQKLKPWASTELEIVDVLEGQDAFNEMLGALVLRVSPDVTFHLGGGYSHQARRELWEQRDQLIGKMCEFKYIERPGVVSLKPVNAQFLRIRWEMNK